MHSESAVVVLGLRQCRKVRFDLASGNENGDGGEFHQGHPTEFEAYENG